MKQDISVHTISIIARNEDVQLDAPTGFSTPRRNVLCSACTVASKLLEMVELKSRRLMNLQ